MNSLIKILISSANRLNVNVIITIDYCLRQPNV